MARAGGVNEPETHIARLSIPCEVDQIPTFRRSCTQPSAAQAARRLIRFWECLQEFAQEWISMDLFYMPKDRSQARWIRRNLYTLENAGLVELRMGRSQANQRITEVRIWRK